MKNLSVDNEFDCLLGLKFSKKNATLGNENFELKIWAQRLHCNYKANIKAYHFVVKIIYKSNKMVKNKKTHLFNEQIFQKIALI